MNEQKTLAEFAAEHALTMDTKFISREKTVDDWECFRWSVTLMSGAGDARRCYSTEYRMGIAHQHWDARARQLPTGESRGARVSQRLVGGRRLTLHGEQCLREWARPTPPELTDVLDSLRSDAESVENSPLFEDWAGDMGYDTDSRKAEQVFHACQEVRGQLIKLIGHKAYNELLQDIERL